MKTGELEITRSNEGAGGPDELGVQGEQDPGLPGFGVHLGEHSSNPGVKRGGKGKECRVPGTRGSWGPRPAIQGLRMSSSRGKGTVGNM